MAAALFIQRARAAMGTVVSIRAGGGDEQALERAFAWFERVERCCSRFDPESELSRLSRTAGVAVPVSAMLLELLQFALAVAEASGGAFDITVGQRMVELGFNRNYRDGSSTAGSLGSGASEPASFRDVRVDAAAGAVTLLHPLRLDLGAVAKGMAVDLAARELAPLGDFAIDAGGDLYLGGRNPEGEPWRVGIRHPRRDRELIATVAVSDRAVCTSGDYERPGREPGTHHLLDPRTGEPARLAISATVIAPTAMVADALATAALVMGPREGIAFLERQQVEGMIVSPELECHATGGF